MAPDTVPSKFSQFPIFFYLSAFHVTSYDPPQTQTASRAGCRCWRLLIIQGLCEGIVTSKRRPLNNRSQMDHTVTSQNVDHTQRGLAIGILAELEAEGYHDAEPVGRGGFGVVYRCR